MIAMIDHDAVAAVAYLDREQRNAGRAVRVAEDSPNAVAHVSCGRIARSLWAVIVDPDTGAATARTARSAKLAWRAINGGVTGDARKKPS